MSFGFRHGKFPRHPSDMIFHSRDYKYPEEQSEKSEVSQGSVYFMPGLVIGFIIGTFAVGFISRLSTPKPHEFREDWNIGVMSGANRMMDMARDGYLTNAHSQQETIDELFRRCYVEWPKYRP